MSTQPTEAPIEVPIGHVLTVGAGYPRRGVDDARIGEFVTLYRDGGPTALPPVDVVADGDEYLVADGWHRTHSLRALGATTMLVRVLPPDGDPLAHAYLHALATAATAALPLTRSERRAAAVRLLVDNPQVSDREVGRRVGLAPTTVGKIRRATFDLDPVGRDEPDDGDRYIAAVTAAELARRLVVGVDKLWEARGLADMVLGDRTGRRLAAALRDQHGPDAATWARRYAGWFTDCLTVLDTPRPPAR